MSWWFILVLLHLVGLTLGAGAATVKLSLLLRCRSDAKFIAAYLSVSKFITPTIISGMILLTVSGIGLWLVLGTAFAGLFIVKLALVVLLWVIGPIIDKVVEPKFISLAPANGEAVTAEFVVSWRRFVAFEGVATAIFYATTVLGLLMQ